MKKILTFLLTLTVILGVTACGDKADNSPASDTTSGKKTVAIQALNADSKLSEIEVPYDPKRIAVLDMPALDILDALDLGERIVGSAKVSIDYLSEYNPDDSDGSILNLGTVKAADLEKVAASEPDIIFIGSRLSSLYSELEAIAPVVYLAVDYEKGVTESTKDNTKTIASIFGKEAQVDDMFTELQPRIDSLNAVLNGKDVLLSMYNSNALNLMGNESQLNIITKELGADNLGETVGESQKASHGEEASWETIITLNPEYLFVLDRSSAVGASDEGIMGAREVVENDLIKELNCYKNGKIIYLIEHANVWYTSTGGIQALDTMLTDLEEALFK